MADINPKASISSAVKSSSGNTNTGANKSAGSGSSLKDFTSRSNQISKGGQLARNMTNFISANKPTLNKPTSKVGGVGKVYTSNTPSLRMGQFDSQLSDFLNSDSYNVMGLKDYRLTANRYASSAKTEDERQYWMNWANDIDGYAYNTINDQMTQLTRMMERYDQGIQNVQNEMKSTASVYNGDYDTAARKNETIQSRLNELLKAKETATAERDALEDELMGYFMTREVWEARERLKENNYAADRLHIGGIFNGILGKGTNQHDEDQALVDDFMHNLGLQAQYFNTSDRLLAKTKAFGERTLAAGAEAFASGGRMAAEMKGDGPDTSFAIDRRDLPTYKEPTKMPQIASVEEGQQRIALAQAEIDKLNQQNADLERSTSDDIGYQLAANNKRLKELNKIVKEYGGQVQALEDQQSIEAGEKPSWSYYLRSGSEDYTLSKIEEFADKHAVKGQLLSQKATADTSPAGKFALDAYEAVLGIAFDGATAALTGGSSLATMFARVYGEEAGNARRLMAENGGIGDRDVLGIKITDRDRQRLYAGAKASIEVITEKMTDGLNLVYGKGITSDIVEDAIQRVAKTDLGADFLRLLAGAGGEGMEELVSGLMDPIAQWLIDEDARGHYASLLDPKELAYEAVMGLALGLVGSSAEFAQQRTLTNAGSEASKNIQYTNKLNEKYDQIMERLGEDTTSSITGKEQKMIDHLTERVEARNAKNKATFGSKAGLSVDEKGRIQIGKGKSSGATRFEKLREGELERAEALGIGEKVEYNEEGYPESDNEARAKDREVAATGGITEEEAEEDRILSGADDANAPRRATGVQEASEDIPEDTGPAPKKEKSYEDSKKERETQIDEIMGKLDSKGELEVDSRENSRDPEFQRFNKDENKGKRVITRNTLEKMKSATREQPIFFYSDAFDTRDGQMPPRAAMYDGNTLYMVRKGNDGKMYLATVNNNALRQATYIEGMITPYTAGKPARWYSTMNGYGGIADTYARSILEQHGVDLSMVDTSESATDGAEAQGAPEGISVPPQGTETVKPGTTPTQEGAQTNGQETTATAGSTTAEEASGDLQASDEKGRAGGKRTLPVFERGGTQPNNRVAPRFASRAPRFTGVDAEHNSEHWQRAAELLEDNYGAKVLGDADLQRIATPEDLAIKDAIEKEFGIPVTFFKGNLITPTGFVVNGASDAGLFIDINWDERATTIFHELTHRQWEKHGFKQTWDYNTPDGIPFLHESKISRKSTVVGAFKAGKADVNEIKDLINQVLYTWGREYVAKPMGIDVAAWKAMSDKERVEKLNQIHNSEETKELMYEEIGNLLATEDGEWLAGYKSLSDSCAKYRQALIDNSIYTSEEMKAVLDAVHAFDAGHSNARYGLSKKVGAAEPFEGADSRLKDGRTSTQAVNDRIANGNELAEVDKELKKNVKPISDFDASKPFALYSISNPNNKREKKLLAVRNTSFSSAIRTLKDGGFPMPSIAIIKAKHGHRNYGPISFIIKPEAIDPSNDPENVIYSTDAWTPQYPDITTTSVENTRKVFKKNSAALAQKYHAFLSEQESIVNDIFLSSTNDGDFVDFAKNTLSAELDYLNQTGVTPEEFKEKVGNLVDVTKRILEDSHRSKFWDAKKGQTNAIALSHVSPVTGEVTDFHLTDEDGNKLKNAGKMAALTFRTADLDELGEILQLPELTNSDRAGSLKLLADIVDLLAETYTNNKKNGDNPYASIDFPYTSLYKNAIKSSGLIKDYADVDLLFLNKFKPGKPQKIFRKSGKSVTNENALELMKDDVKRRASHVLGMESVRPVLARIFSSLEEVKSNDYLLTEDSKHEDTGIVYDKAQSSYDRAEAKLSKYLLTESDLAYYDSLDYDPPDQLTKIAQELSEKVDSGVISSKEDINREILNLVDKRLNESDKFRSLSENVKSAELKKIQESVVDTFNKISMLPTGYFEAKPRKILDLDSFAAIMVPFGDEYEQLVDLANNAGIEVIRYSKHNNKNDAQFKSRIEKLEKKKTYYEQKLKELEASGWNTINVEKDYRLDDFEEPGVFQVDDYDSFDFFNFEDNDNWVDKSQLTDLINSVQKDIDKLTTEYSGKSRSQTMAEDMTRFLWNMRPESPHTPGKTKPMTSAQSGLETRGERQTRKENAAPGAETFTSRTNEARSETARLLTDTQEKANAQYRRLMEDGYTFNDDDVVLAQKLLADMQNAIRDFQLKSGNKMSRAGFDQLTKQYNKLFDKHMAEKSRMGQGLQAEYVFSTAERIKQRAAIMFLGFSPDGRFAGKAPGYKNAKMYGIVSDLANRIETAETAGDSKALVNLCRDISTIRGTQKMAGVLSGQAAKMETKLLNQIANHENGAQALAQLAYANANRISDDLSDLKAGEVVKSIRVMNMLSNVATIINNLGNNLVSGGIGIFSQNAVGQLAQKPFEKLTGQKVLSKAASGGIVNKAIRNAQVEALQFAALMQYYGAVEENGRLELNNRASFNPNANAFEQTMSMYRFLIGMGVEATDKMKAAGLTKAMQIGIDADFAAGKIDATTKAKMESEAAHEVNKLLYKDDNKTTALVQHVKDWLNSLLTVGNEQTGTVGLGDITMAFAKIPANVVKARLAMTPEGALYYTAKYFNGLAKAKTMHEQTVARSISEAVDENGDAISDDAKWARARQECSPRVWSQLNKLRTASGGTMNFDSACAKLGYSTAEEMTHFEMATVSRNLGKAATSVGMVALGAALRAIGAIRDFDQEPDEDKKKLLRQKGYTGLMFNVSAIGRPNHEWQDGDTVIGADWLETVAMPLAIGASAAEAAIDGGNVADTLAGKSLMKAIAAVGDIPGMQDAMNFYDSFNNSYVNSEKDTLAKIGDTAVTYLANQLPAFVVPNLFSQASAGIDNTVRNTYAADTTFGKAKNILLNKTGPIAGNVFGLREQIPASVDMWGEERTYGENWVMGLVNKVILPGDVRKYHVNKYEKELYRLSNEGYGSVLPKSSVSTSFDVDGQTFKLTSAEQETWRRDRAAIQRVDIERFLDSETYKELNDRQRQAVLKQLAMDAERTAKKAYLDTKDTSAEVTFAKWETDLNLDEQIEYLGAREILKGVWDDNEHTITDYAGMDDFITRYNGLTNTQKEIIDNNCSYLDDLAEAKEHKINSEQWEQAHNIYRYWQDKISESKDDEYKSNLVNEVQMWSQMQSEVGLNDRQMDYLEKNMQLRYQGTPKADQYYEYINDAGLSREQATGLITDMSKLDIMDGYSQVQDSQKYMSIATSNKLKTQKEKWAAFWAIVPSNASKTKVASMKNYESMGLSLENALRNTGWSEIKWKELQPNGKWKYYTVSK